MNITALDVAGILAFAHLLSFGLYVELLCRHRRAKDCIIRLRNERDELRGKLCEQPRLTVLK